MQLVQTGSPVRVWESAASHPTNRLPNWFKNSWIFAKTLLPFFETVFCSFSFAVSECCLIFVVTLFLYCEICNSLWKNRSFGYFSLSVWRFMSWRYPCLQHFKTIEWKYCRLMFFAESQLTIYFIWKIQTDSELILDSVSCFFYGLLTACITFLLTCFSRRWLYSYTSRVNNFKQRTKSLFSDCKLRKLHADGNYTIGHRPDSRRGSEKNAVDSSRRVVRNRLASIG